MAVKRKDESIELIDVRQGRVQFYLLGQSPLICNAMSAKARQQLLMPPGRKSTAEKAISLKHHPLQEYRDSVYYARDPDSATLITLKATAFKKAAMNAALDIPGAKKAQMGRLMYVVGDEVPIYGVPELMMSVTRSADMNHTPDVRTRAILPVWCASVVIEYAEPMLKAPVLTRLMAAAGMTQGVGDWRVEKGSGNYGRFSVVEADHPQVRLLMEAGGRAAQQEALSSPTAYDSETESLLSWFDSEIKLRGYKEVA